MERIFYDIPEQEVERDGVQHFARLAAKARETNWGMNEAERRIIGLCVMVEEAQEQIESSAAFHEGHEVQMEELRAQLKGEQMRNGKLKKQVENLKAKKSG